jgi:hypothetical protein
VSNVAFSDWQSESKSDNWSAWRPVSLPVMRVPQMLHAKASCNAAKKDHHEISKEGKEMFSKKK